MQEATIHRREFLKAGAGSLLVAGAAALRAQAPGSRRLEKIGLQLSTVTALMLEDFEGTLREAADIGYDQVEFSARGFLGRDVSEVRALLAELGLEAPLGRVSWSPPDGYDSLSREQQRALRGGGSSPEVWMESVERSLDDAVALGQESLIMPGMSTENFQSMERIEATAAFFNRAGAMCRERGVMFGFHNHAYEFVPVNHRIPYDFLIEETDPQLVTFQLDAYWMTKAGGNLSEYLARYPGRFSSCHMKDIDTSGDFADVGDGTIDFPKFTREALAAGAKHFFVERDNPPHPAESMRRSYAYLKQMTF